MERIFYIEPALDVELYINLGYQMYMYNEVCRTCYSNCKKECENGCIDSTYDTEMYKGEYPSIGLKIVSRSKTVRLGVDLNGGYFDSHFKYGRPHFYAKLLIGFGYPEIISASLLGGVYSYESSCGWFGCLPDFNSYSAISLQYRYRNYFVSATILVIKLIDGIGVKRINLGVGFTLR